MYCGSAGPETLDYGERGGRWNFSILPWPRTTWPNRVRVRPWTWRFALALPADAAYCSYWSSTGQMLTGSTCCAPRATTWTSAGLGVEPAPLEKDRISHVNIPVL